MEFAKEFANMQDVSSLLGRNIRSGTFGMKINMRNKLARLSQDEFLLVQKDSSVILICSSKNRFGSNKRHYFYLFIVQC